MFSSRVSGLRLIITHHRVIQIFTDNLYYHSSSSSHRLLLTHLDNTIQVDHLVDTCASLQYVYLLHVDLQFPKRKKMTLYLVTSVTLPPSFLPAYRSRVRPSWIGIWGRRCRLQLYVRGKGEGSNSVIERLETLDSRNLRRLCAYNLLGDLSMSGF